MDAVGARDYSPFLAALLPEQPPRLDNLQERLDDVGGGDGRGLDVAQHGVVAGEGGGGLAGDAAAVLLRKGKHVG